MPVEHFTIVEIIIKIEQTLMYLQGDRLTKWYNANALDEHLDVKDRKEIVLDAESRKIWERFILRVKVHPAQLGSQSDLITCE